MGSEADLKTKSVASIASQKEVLRSNEALQEAEEGQVEYEEDAGFDLTSFKVSSLEKSLYSLLHGMIKDGDMGLKFLLPLIFLEDLQLFAFSWRTDMGVPSVVRYIFNPLLALADNFTFASHVVIFALGFILIASLIYCGFSFASGRVKHLTPLYVLRGLTIFFSTIGLIPILQTFIIPTTCYDDSSVRGYDPASVTCFSGSHVGILATSAAGAFFTIFYALLMSLFHFNSSPESEVGKRNGRADILFVLIRIGLVVIDNLVEKTAATAVNSVLIAMSFTYYLSQQPFYSGVVNNMRVGIQLGALTLSISAAIFNGSNSNGWGIYLGLGLGFSVILAVAGYYFNSWMVAKTSNHVLSALREYSNKQSNKVKSLQNIAADLRKSYLDMLYTNANSITTRVAKKDVIAVFPSPEWVEVSVRFLRTSYLDKDAQALALKIFEVALLQFPTSAQVYLVYLSYIHEFFPALKGKERLHLSIMTRKCRFAIDDRFQTYVHQQMLAHNKGEDDGEFTSYIEYQSMENIVKKYHVDTLVELRDFWQAIRNGNTGSQVLADRLSRVAAASAKASELYKKMVVRFPNKQNLYLLYARFLALVLSDEEQAQSYSTQAEDLEYIGDRNKDDGESILKSKSIRRAATAEGSDAGSDAQSKGQSSNASGASREAKLQRQKRTLLSTRLELPMKQYVSRGNISSFVFLVMLIVAVVFSKTVIDETSSNLEHLHSSMISRRYLEILRRDVRRLQIFTSAEKADYDQFEQYSTDILTHLEAWQTDVQPFYNQLPIQEAHFSLSLWDNYTKTYTVKEVNNYMAANMLVDNLVGVMGDRNLTGLYEKYRSTDPLTNDYFRFFFDNTATIYDAFDEECAIIIEEYDAFINSNNVVLIALFSVVFAILILAGIVIPHRSLKECYDYQFMVLGLFTKVPKAISLGSITNLEEEIEVITGESERLQSNVRALGNDNQKSTGFLSSMTLNWKYVLMTAFLTCGIPGMLYVILNHTMSTDNISHVYNESNQRPAIASKITMLASELVIDDRSTWKPYEIDTEMERTIYELHHVNDVVAENLQAFLPPYGSTDSSLYIDLKIGRCFYENCEEMPWDASIGYTEELMTSGIDHQMIRFADEAKHYLEEHDYDLNNHRLRLMDLMQEDLLESLEKVNLALLEIVQASVARTSLIMFILFGFCIFISILAYYFGFFEVSKEFEADNKMLISLLYSVTVEERKKIPELHQFIESGGAILSV